MGESWIPQYDDHHIHQPAIIIFATRVMMMMLVEPREVSDIMASRSSSGAGKEAKLAPKMPHNVLQSNICTCTLTLQWICYTRAYTKSTSWLYTVYIIHTNLRFDCEYRKWRSAIIERVEVDWMIFTGCKENAANAENGQCFNETLKRPNNEEGVEEWV